MILNLAQTEGDASMKPKLTFLVIMVMSVLLLFSGVTFAEGPPDDGGEVFGKTDGEETAISEGSVLGQATLRDSKCVVDSPITVGARVPNGSAGSVIIWAFDDECRAVVQEIRPVQEGEAGPAEGGQSESPTPSGTTTPDQSSRHANAASSVETKTGWVKYFIGEQFDLPATQV